MAKRKVLISGAGIAGPMLAFWLKTYDFDVTVVEQSETIRSTGQNIDLKGASKEIVQKMGIFEAIKARSTGEQGSVYVDKDNEITACFEMGELGGLTSELEILRGDLVELLYSQTKDSVKYIFDDFIADIKNDEDSVEILFNRGNRERYDVVVGADGVGSRLREKIFSDEFILDFLGLYTAYFTIPKGETDNDWARWYVATDSRSIIVRPDNKGTTRVALNFLSSSRKYEGLSKDQLKIVLIEKFKDAEWETDRILDGLQKTDDLYFDAVTQVKMPSWSKGRVVLIGDAAYCPTPISGKGTVLAIIGAYILANELSANVDHTTAFAKLEEKFRPYVEKNQKLPKSLLKLFYPSSGIGVGLLNKLESVISSKVFQKIAAIFSSEKSDEDDFELPVYTKSNK